MRHGTSEKTGFTQWACKSRFERDWRGVETRDYFEQVPLMIFLFDSPNLLALRKDVVHTVLCVVYSMKFDVFSRKNPGTTCMCKNLWKAAGQEICAAQGIHTRAIVTIKWSCARAQGAPPGLTAPVPQPSRQQHHLINQQQQLHQVQEQAGETVVAFLSFAKQEKSKMTGRYSKFTKLWGITMFTFCTSANIFKITTGM